MKAMHKVLSTKKLDASLIEKAKEHDIEIIEREFISIKPIWNQETGERIIELAKARKHNVVLTSANAVDMLSHYMKQGDTYYMIKWSLFCLSGKTKEAILNSENVEKNIIAEATNASGLADEIIKRTINEIVFFCGDKRRDELPTILKEAGVIVHEIVLYETIETPQKVEGDFDAVMFFSPSGVQSFFSANQLDKETVCFAIGTTTWKSIRTFTRNRISSSIAPTQQLLVGDVINYFETGVLEQGVEDEN